MPLHGMLLGASVMGLADGPTEVHKVTVARQVLRELQGQRRPLAHPAPPEADGRGPARSTPSTSSTKWGTCDRHRPPRRAGWTTRACPARASRSSTATSPAARRTRSTRSAAASSTARSASRRRPRPRRRDGGIIREWRIIEALDGTDVPHTAGHRRLHRHRRCSAAPSTSWASSTAGRRWASRRSRRQPAVARAVRHRPRGPQGPRLPAGRGHRAARQRRLAGEGARRTSAGPTASTSARSTAGPPSSSASRAVSSRASTRPPPGCAPTSRSTTSRA